MEWTGGTAGVAVRQLFTLGESQLHFTITVTLTNVSGGTLNDVYFYRSVDPNQEEAWTTDYATLNWVDSQGSSPNGTAVVSAAGASYSSMVLKLSSTGSDARVAHGGSAGINPVTAHAGTAYQVAINPSTPNYMDEAITLVRKVSTLADGASATFVIQYDMSSNTAPLVDLDANDSTAVGQDAAVSYTSGGPAVNVADSDATVISLDGSTLSSMTLTLVGALDGVAETLAATTTGTSISASWSGGVLTLSGSDTVANYQQVLRSVTYQHASGTPSAGERRIDVVANDGSNSSSAASSRITIAGPAAAAPVVATVEGSALAYTENDAATTISATLTVSDADSANLSGATVSISANYASGEDVLAFSNQNGITGSWNSGTGVLTLSGSATLADYQTALRSITYVNSSEAPSTATRTVSFVVNDGTANSAAATRNISVAATNEAPVLTLPTLLAEHSPTLAAMPDQSYELKSDQSWGQSFVFDSTGPTYTVGGIGLVLYRASDAPPGQTLTVSLRSSWNGAVIASGTVAGNTLSTSEAWVSVPLSAAATLNDGQTYFIRVESDGPSKLYLGAADPGAYGGGDLINKDGVAESGKDAAFRLLRAAAFTEGGTSAVLAPNAQVFDAELTAADNFSGATLTLSRNGGPNAQDTLAFDGVNVTTSGANVSVGGVQVGTYTFTGGELAVSFGASATQARVNTLLRNIVYGNTSDAPPASVQIDWTFSDGNAGAQGTGGALPATGSTTVSITATNDAPTLGNGALTAVSEDTVSPAGQAISTIFTGQFADADTGSSLGGIAVVGNTANAGTEGAWQYSSNGGTNWYAIGTVADGATALAIGASNLIRFVPVAHYNGTPTALTLRGLDNSYVAGFSTTAGSEIRVTVNTTTNGGSTAIAAATAALSTSITAVNDAPVLDNSGTMTLTTITEDQTSNNGNTVAEIVASAGGDRIADVDAGAVEGIAILATSATEGLWQYSIDAGSSWTDVGSVGGSSSLLLRAIDRVRFLPNGDDGVQRNHRDCLDHRHGCRRRSGAHLRGRQQEFHRGRRGRDDRRGRHRVGYRLLRLLRRHADHHTVGERHER